MNKKILVFIAFLFTGMIVFAEVDIWQNCDQDTMNLLATADTLIAERKYESAFKSLGTSDTNAYIVAKKVEICLNFFVQSMNHQFFALKDLSPKEDLETLRKGSGTYKLYSFDPVEVINKFPPENRPIILFKSLGDYYYEVSLRYRGRWLEDDRTIAQKAIENYRIAYQNNFYTVDMLLNYAEKEMELGDFHNAIELYEKAFSEDTTLDNAHYNLAYAYLMTEDFDRSIKNAEIAIEKYKDNPNYLMDALLLCADAYYYNGQSAEAIECLKRSLDISDADYRVYRKLGYVYLSQGDINNADNSFDALFSLAPAHPSVSQMVMQAYMSFDRKDDLVSFFLRNLEKYSGQNEISGNLYFHFALLYHQEKDSTDASKYASQAKDCFIKAGEYSGDIQESIETLLGENQI